MCSKSLFPVPEVWQPHMFVLILTLITASMISCRAVTKFPSKEDSTCMYNRMAQKHCLSHPVGILLGNKYCTKLLELSQMVLNTRKCWLTAAVWVLCKNLKFYEIIMRSHQFPNRALAPQENIWVFECLDWDFNFPVNPLHNTIKPWFI